MARFTVLSKREILFLANMIDRELADMDKQDQADALLDRVAKNLHGVSVQDIRSEFEVDSHSQPPGHEA